MINLAEVNLQLIHRYADLLHTIEEGMEYVARSFNDYSKTEGDIVFADVLDALAQLQLTNEQLQAIFAEEQDIIKAIQQYGTVIDQCFKLEGKMEHLHEKQEVIKKSIIPAFLAWKQLIEANLKPYIIQ